FCVEGRHDFHLPKGIGTVGLLLRRERRRERVNPLREDHRAGGEVAVPEVGHGNRLLDEGHLGRRRVLRRLVRCRLLGDEEHIVGAGRDGERSGDTQWVLRGGPRHERVVFVGVILLLAFVVLLFVVLFVVLLAVLLGGRRGRRLRFCPALRDNPPVERHLVARHLRRINADRERHVFLV